MESTAQREVDLHKKASENLREAGYNVTPEDLNPNDQTALESLQEALGDAAQVVGGKIEERLKEQTIDTHVGVTPGKRLGRWVLDRFRRKQK